MSRGSVSIEVLEDFDMNLSRNSDYVTSHLAAEHIASSLPTLQARMLRAFTVERTANEAAEYCFQIYGEKSKESYRKRCHELAQAGHIFPLRSVRIANKEHCLRWMPMPTQKIKDVMR
jgi:hypothetical protein